MTTHAHREDDPLASVTTQREGLRQATLVLACLGLACTLLVLLYFFHERPAWSSEAVTLVSLAAAGLGLLAFGLAPRLGLFGFAAMYFAYLVLAHMGMAGATLISERGLADLRPGQLVWFYSPERDLAVALSGMATAAFALGAVVASMLSGPRDVKAVGLDTTGKPLIFSIGVGLLALCTGYFVFATLTGALPLGGSYSVYRDAMDRLWTYPYLIGFLSIGLTFVFATGDSRRIRRAAPLMVIPALVLLASGNRGELLYPIAAVVTILYMRGLRVPLRTLVVFGVGILVLTTAIGSLRAEGIGTASLADAAFSPTEPFVELGYQLRPLTGTVTWIENGEELAYGGTYRVPIQRLAGLVMPWIERPPLDDPKLDLKGRTPSQGYSVVAEAYFNFGAAGVLLVLPMLAATLVWIQGRSSSFATLATSGAILAVLVNNIRNTFVFLPAQVAVILVLVGLALLPDAILRARHRTKVPLT